MSKPLCNSMKPKRIENYTNKLEQGMCVQMSKPSTKTTATEKPQWMEQLALSELPKRFAIEKMQVKSGNQYSSRKSEAARRKILINSQRDNSNSMSCYEHRRSSGCETLHSVSDFNKDAASVIGTSEPISQNIMPATPSSPETCTIFFISA